jgi:hypothetical protein
VAQLLDMWWLSGRDVMAQWEGCYDSTIGDMVAKLAGCNGSVGLNWWHGGRN